MEDDAEAPDLVCQMENAHAMADTLSSIRWKRHQDALVKFTEHGLVFTVEENGCLQGIVYLKRELFIQYEYHGKGRPKFGLSLGLFVDCLNTFSLPGSPNTIEIQYPGPDKKLLLKSVDLQSRDACIYAEIRTRIPETSSWDFDFEPAGSTPITFAVKSAALKEAIEDLEWPGASVRIILQPDPPSVSFRSEGHGDLQIDFAYYAHNELLVAFQCNHPVSYRYKYKFLKATTSNLPGTVVKEDRRSKLSIGQGGMLRVQHLVPFTRQSASHVQTNSAGYQPPQRIAHVEFFVKPEEDEGEHVINDS